MMFFLNNNKKYISLLMVAVLFFNIFFFLPTQKTMAQVAGFGSAVSNLGTGGSTVAMPATGMSESGLGLGTSVAPTGLPVQDKASIWQRMLKTIRDTWYQTMDLEQGRELTFKEYFLDPIAWTAANVLIDKFADSLVVWIKSGFNGSPMFLSDPAGFFKDTANDLSGALINDINANWLCDALGKFRLDLNFFLPGTSRSKYACTFEDIANNIQNAAGKDNLGDWINVNVNVTQQNIVRRYGDDFRNGGWWMWLATAESKNNNLGRTIDTANSVYAVSESQKNQEKFGLSINGGFFGLRKCMQYDDIQTAEQTGKKANCTKWVDTTPGALVQDQLNKTTSWNLDRLKVADEINEIVGALASTMIGMVLNGGSNNSGLLGYKAKSDSERNSQYYGTLSDSQQAVSKKVTISNQAETVKDKEGIYGNALGEYSDAVYGAKNKLQIVLAKLECIYATSTNDTTYDYAACDDSVESIGKNLSAKNKTYSDVSADIAKVETGISDIDDRISSFNSAYGDNATTTSASALGLLDSFESEVLQTTQQSEITSIQENYCYAYDKKNKTAQICGLFSDTATEKETYTTHSDKDFNELSKKLSDIQIKMDGVVLKYACVLNDYTGAEDVSSGECSSASSSASST